VAYFVIMHSYINPAFRRGNLRLLVVAGMCFCTIAAHSDQPPTPPNPPPAAASPQQLPGSQIQALVWDADLKEVTSKQGDATAKFTFSITNISDSEVVIKDAHPSCGCTEATMPSKPWHLGPHSNGVINVGVNLAGKSGTIFKWVDVTFGSNEQKRLSLKVIMPEDKNMLRSRNQQMASGDRQAVFKGDCAKCHAEPTKDENGKEKMGKDLYVAACDICHGAVPRATMVPDLHALNHSTDYIYWKVWISGGKPGTLMPAFSQKEGGPLSDEQIESLAQVMVKSFPSDNRAFTIKTIAPAPAQVVGAVPPINPPGKN